MRFILIILALLYDSTCVAQKNCIIDLNSTNNKVEYILLADSLQKQDFVTRNKKRFLPKSIKRALKCKANNKFRIANPDKPYNAGDAIIKNWPRRKINYIGLNKNYLILSYEHGGFGHHSHTLIFKYNKKNIEKVYSLIASAKSKEETISYLHFLELHPNLISYTEF